MAKIPTVTSQVSATSGRPGNALPRTRASAASFDTSNPSGARAINRVAAGLDSVSAGFASMRKEDKKEREREEIRRRQETVANAVAQSDFTPTELELRQNAPADGRGYHGQVVENYRQFIEENAAEIEDPEARRQYRVRMFSQTPAISSRSIQFETTMRATHSKEQADASILSIRNKIRANPDQFDDYVQQGNEVIDAREDLPAATKEAMKLNFRLDAAKGRFVAMAEGASTVEEIDAITAELTNVTGEGRDWTGELKPGDFDKLLNDLGTTRRAITTKEDTAARARMTTLEEMSNNNILIPESEIADVTSMTARSGNPATIGRLSRLVRNQSLIKDARRMTPAQLRETINRGKGTPGAAYPGLPGRVSAAVNDATSKFDVSAGYLGGTAVREYGRYLGKRRTADPDFAPVAAPGRSKSLAGVSPVVVEAGARVGQRMGEPLTIVSGHRTQGQQNAIRARGNPNRKSVAKRSFHTRRTALDISTAGMSDERKAELVGHLVDEGFTGIGQYKTHIHADFRDNVPKSLDLGNNYGGWTNLNPGITAVLKEKGYKPGASAKDIVRSGSPLIEPKRDIDYGRGTDVKGPDGKPATSATGLFQFTEGTFLEIIKDPKYASRIGVDTEGVSDAALLELRKDPEISTLAAAALAEKNKAQLYRSTGKIPTDAELAMAHVLGAAGATALIKANASAPYSDAAKLLPQAAANNKGVFYENGKPLTVEEVYDEYVGAYESAPGRVAYGDVKVQERVLKWKEEGLKNDPITHAAQANTHTISPLGGEGGFVERGDTVRSISEYYDIPVDQTKPFSKDEAVKLAEVARTGSPEEVVELLASMEQMGGDVARAALKQVSEDDAVFALAGGLYLETRNGQVATDIVKGRKRLDESPTMRSDMGADKITLGETFLSITEGALLEADPRQRQAIMDAALAHYAETHFARTGQLGFNPTAFENSINRVLGGGEGAAVLDDVNGETTVLPPGLSGDTVEEAVERMTVDDWAQLSVDKNPPAYQDGEIIAPEDIRDEGQFRAIGGNRYRLVIGDEVAVTGEVTGIGNFRAFVFEMDVERMNDIASRPMEAAIGNSYRNRVNSFNRRKDGGQ